MRDASEMSSWIVLVGVPCCPRCRCGKRLQRAEVDQVVVMFAAPLMPGKWTTRGGEYDVSPGQVHADVSAAKPVVVERSSVGVQRRPHVTLRGRSTWRAQNTWAVTCVFAREKGVR